MPYVALEWDHRIGRPFMQWLVVECASVGRKFGGPQALPPRHDVAYFVDPATAERDAKAFADYKNRQSGTSPAGLEGTELAYSDRHAAFEWDHDIFRAQVRWAVLEWNGQHAEESVRNDVAYFLDPATAEGDARAFRVLRDTFEKVPASAGSTLA